MMKRIIALFLALILTVGLLPTVALAAEGNPPTTDSGSVTKEASKDNLNLVKTVTKEGDNYKVTLESWATGTVTSSSTPVPMDIILLLDQSGSMKKNFTSSSTETYNNLNKKNKKIYADYRNNCYIKSGNQYLKVTVTYQWEFGFSNDVYTYTWNGGSHTSTGGNSKPKIPLFYKSTTNSSTTRIAALKTAVSSFINKVNTEATTKNVDHRVAVVGFASTRSDYYENTELLSTPDVVNYGSANNIDYRNALVSAKTNKNKLDTAINRLAASGDTYPEYGFDMANKIFAQHPIQAGDNRQRVVIMFTDGYPAPANTDNFNVGMANNAINNAKRCKDNNAKVYTIGIFDGADPSASIENYSQNGWLNEAVAANRYMHFSSSNYPSAMALNNGGTKGEGNFYFAASNADALNDIFDTISEEISTDTTELDDSATIIDNIPGNFAIPEDAKNITLKVAKFQKDGTFATATTAPTTVTAEHKDGTVTVTGFNFSDEWCGLNESDQPHGSKLIIEFTIHHNNYGGTQPTNAGASIKDEAGKEVIKVDDPTVPVTISKPDDVFTQANEKTYDGTGFDIFDEVAKKADDLANGTNNAFVDIEVKITVEGTDYIYTISKGQQSGTWKQTASPKTSPNVKDEDKNGTPEAYEYPVTITFKDAAEDSTASNSTTATAKFTINYAEAKVKANDKNKKATEADPDFDATVTGMVNDEDATQKLTYTISRTDADDNTVGDHQTITPIGDTYQNNYKVTYETGTLTITKDDTTEIELIIVGNTLEQTYNGQVHTANNYKVTYPAGTSPTDFQIVTSKTASVSATDVKTTAEGTVDADGRYMMGLTAKDFTVTSEKYGKIKVTYTDGWLKITPLAVTLTSGSGSKEYDGTALTNSKVEATGAGAERFLQEVNDFKANGSVKGTADMTTAQSVTNNISYTWKDGFSASNYTITTNPGTLTITPVSQFKITFKTDNGGKIDGDTVDIEKTAKRNDPFPTVPTTEANTGYYFLGWYDESGNKVEENAFPKKVTGNATYTAKWKKYDSVTLNLTGRFQKELTSDTATLPENANSFTLNIKNDNSQTVAQAHVLNVPLEQKSSKYTGTKAFAVESGSEMTFNAAGTYIYTVAEAAGSISGMSYDDTTYTMTVEVVANEGKLTIQSATIEGGTVDTVNLLAAEGTNSITFHNEYTKPKKSINLGDLIQKDFGKKAGSEDLPTGSSYTFRVRAYERFRKPDGSYCYSDAPYLGEVVMTEFGQKNFVFNYGVITFFEHGTHEYVVEEFNDSAENVEYDSNRYLLVLNVADDLTITARNAGSLNDEVSTQSVEQTPVITFCNKYNKEKDPDKLTINFADYVQKELTATGTKTASDVDFTVDVKGKEQTTIITSAEGEEAISTYADEFDPKYSRTLTAHFDSITGGETKTTPFTGSVEITRAGQYIFELREEDGQRTGVTYDETIYTLHVLVDEKEGSLAVTRWYFTDSNRVEHNAGEKAAFHNTIDTGRDDYIPIIIPTIINKDTGMLNKTDHFAYVIGYPDGTVHPNGQITRAEVATIFFRLLRDEVRDGAFTTSNSYSDVAYGKWYNNPISTMSALGSITGYPDGTFKPNKPITRAEFAAIAARFDETQSGKSATFSDVIGHWAAKEIGIAYYNDWIKGYPDGTFKPDQNITRAEAMTLINRVLERKPESPADLLTNMNKWTDNLDTSKWYYLDVQEATNSHGYTRKTFNYELWRQMLPDPDWSRYER